MNNLNRVKFLIKNLFSKSSFEDKIYINSYINDKSLRKNKNYSLAIVKLMECRSTAFATFLGIETLQKSEKFDLIIEKLFNKHTNDEYFISGLGNSYLEEKDRYDDIVLKGLEYTNKDNLHYYMELCEYYYYFIDFGRKFIDVEFDPNKYKYMVEKFITLKDDPIAKIYFSIFSKLEMLESDDYTTFIDRVMEIKDQKELCLLNIALDKCAKNCGIDGFTILDSLNKIEDDAYRRIYGKDYRNMSKLDKDRFKEQNAANSAVVETKATVKDLYNEKVALFMYDTIDILFSKVLSQNDDKVILECLELLKHEIESNINADLVEFNNSVELAKSIELAEFNTINLEKLIDSKIEQSKVKKLSIN